jgi:predicted MFS family arabinose efflux permease
MRPALPVSLAVSASLLGDTFLYTVLPVSAARLGVEPLLVGLILSLNRWVRLFTNPLAARLYERLPAGWLVLGAVVLAAVSTALCVDPAWVVVIVAARLLWGFCFSLLRLGAVLAAIDEAGTHAGRKLGETRAIWGLGYLAGALYAPFALEVAGWPAALLGAAALTIAAGLGPALIARAWRRRIVIDDAPTAPFSVWQPHLALLCVCGSAQLLVGAGILVVAGGIRISELYEGGAAVLGAPLAATFIAAAFVLTQRVAQVVWQPFAGRLADHALDATFILSLLLAVAALLVLTTPVSATLFIAAAAVANFTGLAASIAIELAVAKGSAAADRPRSLAALHTWQDGGAAAGALAGGALAAIGTSFALVVAAAVLAATLPLWWLARGPARIMVTT